MDRAAIVVIIVTVVMLVDSERRGDKPSLDPATTGLFTRCRALRWGVWVASWVRESNSVRRPTPSKPLMYRTSLPPRTGPTSPASYEVRTLEAWTLSKKFLKRNRDCWLQPGPRGKAALAGATSVDIFVSIVMVAQGATLCVLTRKPFHASVCFRLSSK